MREIKFRFWEVEDKAMKHWEDFACLDMCGMLNTNENTIAMQYTGLKDKNGKEIYEGDVIRVFYKDMEQIEGNEAYKVVIKDMMEDRFTAVGNGQGEVIGNIYENPELLK